MSDSTTNQRKSDHIAILRSDSETDRGKSYFDQYKLLHRALPEVDFQTIDPSVRFLRKKLSFPLLISAMTGGDDDLLRIINRNLAIAAEQTGVAMGVGSQRVMFTHPSAKTSFALRSFAPTAVLLANLGAVQLNEGLGLEHCQQAIDVLEADGLYLHLNPLQEAIQPEGNTRFAGLAKKIGRIARRLSRPVLLKEVGAGFSPCDAELAIANSIRYVDIAGSGGTSWSRVEYARRTEKTKDGNPGLVFQDWGIPTPLALQMLQPFRSKLTLIASGGIRTGVDMAKAMALGASLCGIALPLLEPAMESPEKVMEVILRLKKEFTIALFLLGAKKTGEIVGKKSLIISGGLG